MNMIKIVTGICPVLNDNYSVFITYLDTSTLQETCHIKDMFHCEYNKFGDKCDAYQCPLYTRAPKIL